MAKVITAAQAAELFKDGDFIASSSFGLAGWAEEVALAVEKRFLETGHPKNLTHMHAGGAGNFQGRGGGVWAHDGMTKRLIISHAGSETQVMEAIEKNKCEAINWPLGVILQAYMDAARKGPGVFSKVGLGSFIDPRFDGGRFNAKSKECPDLQEVVNFAGEEWLWYKPVNINIAFLRGTTADEKGNISCEKESLSLELLPIAQAAKANGGITIVQVERLAKAGTLHPKTVVVPEIYVDYVVVAEKPQMQTMVTVYNPAFTGETRMPVGGIPPMPLNEDKIICRRTAFEARPGAMNLGIGIPQGVASILAEEGAEDLITHVSESGSIGGVPGIKGDYGSHYNIESSTSQHMHSTSMTAADSIWPYSDSASPTRKETSMRAS
jgi:propionate CoA-transferase